MTMGKPKNITNESTDEPFGRHNDPTPVKCNRCGWRGQIKDMIHDYRDDGSGEDVEAVDECPECGTDDVSNEIQVLDNELKAEEEKLATIIKAQELPKSAKIVASIGKKNAEEMFDGIEELTKHVQSLARPKTYPSLGINEPINFLDPDTLKKIQDMYMEDMDCPKCGTDKGD